MKQRWTKLRNCELNTQRSRMNLHLHQAKLNRSAAKNCYEMIEAELNTQCSQRNRYEKVQAELRRLKLVQTKLNSQYSQRH